MTTSLAPLPRPATLEAEFQEEFSWYLHSLLWDCEMVCILLGREPLNHNKSDIIPDDLWRLEAESFEFWVKAQEILPHAKTELSLLIPFLGSRNGRGETEGFLCPTWEKQHPEVEVFRKLHSLALSYGPISLISDDYQDDKLKVLW